MLSGIIVGFAVKYLGYKKIVNKKALPAFPNRGSVKENSGSIQGGNLITWALKKQSREFAELRRPSNVDACAMAVRAVICNPAQHLLVLTNYMYKLIKKARLFYSKYGIFCEVFRREKDKFYILWSSSGISDIFRNISGRGFLISHGRLHLNSFQN